MKPPVDRTKPRGQTHTVVGSEREVQALLYLAWANMLTTRQLEQLCFTSRRVAQRRLRALLDHRLVAVHLQQGFLVQRDNVYTMTDKGIAFLIEQGVTLQQNNKPTKTIGTTKLAHSLAIRDVFVAFVAAEKQQTLTLVDFRFDANLVNEPTFHIHGLIPDAVAQVEVNQDCQHWLIEVDRGTESIKTLLDKFSKWRQLLVGGEPWLRSPLCQLLVIGSTIPRVTTLKRLIADAAVPRTHVMSSSELEPWLRQTYSHHLFVQTIRTERIAPAKNVLQINPDLEEVEVAFRGLEES